MRILIVEDFPAMALAAAEVLEALGHDVDWVIGYIDPENLVCMSEDKSEINLNASDYDLVFMDGELEDNGEGEKLVPGFASVGVPVFGTSTISDLNRKLVEAGCVGAATKVPWFMALVNERITPEQFAAFDDDVQAQLDAVDEECRGENRKAFMEQGESLLQKHM